MPFSSLSMSKAASFSVYVDPASSQPVSEPRSSLTRVSSPAENTTLSADMANRPSFATRSHRMGSYRSPLAAVSRHENQPASRMARHSKSNHKHHIPEASRSRSASSEGQPHLHPQELWTRIVSSPPAHNLNMPSERTGSSSTHRDMASRTQRPHINLNRKKHSLDWVCDRQTKRLREDSTDDDDEESDVDDVFRGVSRSFHVSRSFDKSPPVGAGLELLSYTASCQTMVPEEVLASQRDLTTDIICGAAMLVGLKRSGRR